MTLPIRARHSFHHGQYLPPGSFHKLLSSSIRGQTECKPQSQKTKLITWITVLSNSVKLWGMPCRATQDGWWGVLTKCCPLEKGMANHFSILVLRTHGQYEKIKRYDTERWTHRWVGAQYDIGEEWRNSSRRTEEAEQKRKQGTVVDGSGGESEVQCCKEQYCIGTWNVRSMNQDKLEVVKQEMARVNINILGISELKWMGMGEFNSDDHYIYYCGQESHSQQESKMQYLGAISKTTEWSLFISKANNSAWQ